MHWTIPNHYTARLSALDVRTAVCVPPGGNWKNVSENVPSKRIESIRLAYAAGGGSRSTYYGRLHPGMPAYTINTYFNRPGNGCHLHYDGRQHRVLSEREAARLQSFPDRFEFHGSHAAIHRQIGNAVPPLLAYQVARQLPWVGAYVDLFSGAGGLSLGLQWAGWRPIVANDIDNSALLTYQANIDPSIVCGDIRDKAVFRAVRERTIQGRVPGEPLLVVGGPPCQGYSTAGNRRSLDDARVHLFQEYRRLVQEIQPDGFVFENVPGLLNMEGGRVLDRVKEALHIPGNVLHQWILNAEQYAIPQRRTRLFLVSIPARYVHLRAPEPVTWFRRGEGAGGNAVSVQEALADLPALRPGEDGSQEAYVTRPRNPYQHLMRGTLTCGEYLAAFSEQEFALT